MNIVLLLAGGNGNRIGNKTPKQFLIVNNKPIINYSLETFNSIKEIDKIFIVCQKNYINKLKSYIKQFNKVVSIIPGGNTRQESVYLGLQEIKAYKAKDNDNILIHDSARPLITKKIILDNIKSCNKYHAVETAIKNCDTLIKSNDNELNDSLISRDNIYRVQTPQSFKFNLILKVHTLFKNDLSTDDASLIKKYGQEVHIVKGDFLNFKITFKEDLDLLKKLTNKNL